jgi:hypothetical protein
MIQTIDRHRYGRNHEEDILNIERYYGMYHREISQGVLIAAIEIDPQVDKYDDEQIGRFLGYPSCEAFKYHDDKKNNITAMPLIGMELCVDMEKPGGKESDRINIMTNVTLESNTGRFTSSVAPIKNYIELLNSKLKEDDSNNRYTLEPKIITTPIYDSSMIIGRYYHHFCPDGKQLTDSERELIYTQLLDIFSNFI